jgi:hypothetical protein
MSVSFFKIGKDPYRKWNYQLWLAALSELSERFNREFIIAVDGALLYEGLVIGEAY